MRSLLLVFLVLAVSCGGPKKKTSDSQPATKTEVDASLNENLPIDTLVLAVEGMTCTGCEQTVQKSIAALEGVETVKASHTDKTAIITYYRGKLDDAKVTKTVEAVGYKVLSDNAVN